MYLCIDNVKSGDETDRLFKKIIAFAWDAEQIAVAVAEGHVFVDFGDTSPRDGQRLGQSLGRRVTCVEKDPSAHSWFVIHRCTGDEAPARILGMVS